MHTIYSVFNQNISRFASTHCCYLQNVSREISGQTALFFTQFIPALLLLGYCIGFSGSVQANISVDAMDPRAKGESTNKAYTDDEIKWRVGYETQFGGSKRSKVTVNLTGKHTLCDGAIKLPPNWFIPVSTSGEIRDSSAPDFSGVEPFDINYDPTDPENIVAQLEELNEQADEALTVEYDLNELVDMAGCQEAQSIVIETGSWSSENTGVAFSLKELNPPSSYQPGVFLESTPYFNGNKVFFANSAFISGVANGYAESIYCIDIETGDWCADFGAERKLLSGTENPYGRPSLGFTAPRAYYFEKYRYRMVGNSLFYPANKSYTINEISYKSPGTEPSYFSSPIKQFIGYVGVGCFDVNPSQPQFAGPCDGQQGRRSFGNQGYKNLWYGPKYRNSLLGNFYRNGKLFYYLAQTGELFCIDAENGDSCGAPYPVSFDNGEFVLPNQVHGRNSAVTPQTRMLGNKIVVISMRDRQERGPVPLTYSPHSNEGLDTLTTRCWDIIEQDFCWGEHVHKIVVPDLDRHFVELNGVEFYGKIFYRGYKYNNGIVLDPTYTFDRYDENGNADGFCTGYMKSPPFGELSSTAPVHTPSYDPHPFINVGCINLETGQYFPRRDNIKMQTYGIPDKLAARFGSLLQYKNWTNGEPLNGDPNPKEDYTDYYYFNLPGVQYENFTSFVGSSKHIKTYWLVPGVYPKLAGVMCWNWTINNLCSAPGGGLSSGHKFGANSIVPLPSEMFSFWGGNTSKAWKYSLTLQESTGCFWISHPMLNTIVTMDSDGNFPCVPAQFTESRLIDPEALYCASGAPIGWQWNTLELYDFDLADWQSITITLNSLSDGAELLSVNSQSNPNLFIDNGTHLAVDLLNNSAFSTALSGEKRLQLNFYGTANQASIIHSGDKAPTIIATINSKKPLEFCINSITGTGQAGCGNAELAASVSSQNGENGSNESGVQVVEYTPDPESHTQPTLYVDQAKEDGFGIMVRPYIYPVLKQGTNIEVNGISTIQVLFVETKKDAADDKKLFFMEDSDGNRKLEDADNRVVYVPNDKNGMGAKIGASNIIKHFNEVSPLWDAHTLLSELNDNQASNQRNYNNTDKKRYIFTWLDDDPSDSAGDGANDGIVDAGEVVDFTEDIVNLSNKGLFKDIKGGRPPISVDKVRSIIRFVRGDSRVSVDDETLNPSQLADHPERSIVGYRERRIIPPERNTEETFRLGGLRHSKALIVGAPEQSYMSSRYNGDNNYMVQWAKKHDLDDYVDFMETYQDRRLMVYVGGNDGMIHAFNSGFIDFDAREIKQKPASNPSVANRELGQEVWAYVPRAVLPYLNDLTHPQYKPRYYVDGNPLAFDVRMFGDDTMHPGGWGTILVVPMRMGGGFAEVELSSGELADLTPVYIVLDVTDPEQAPELLAEISHEDLGFSTSEPTIIYETYESEVTPYLVFGSGPTNSTFAVSDRIGKVFAYDLLDDTVSVRATLPTMNDADGNPIPMFAGDMKSVNLRSAFTGSQISGSSDQTVLATDVVYFGVSIGTDVRKLGGKIMRLNKNQSNNKLNNLETLLIPKVSGDDLDHPGGRPIVYAPTVSVSFEGKRDELWVYAGTGRLLVDADESNIEQQFVMGIIDKTNYDAAKSSNYPVSVGPTSIQMNKLVDVTNVEVEANGALSETSQNINGLQGGITNERQLAQRIINDNDGDEVDGWVRRFTVRETGVGDNELVVQAGRTTGRVTIIRNQLIVSEFLPPALELMQQCEPTGEQTFYRFAKDNGTAEDPVMTTFSVMDASLNDADYIDWDGDIAIDGGSTTRLDEEDFYGLGGYGKRIRWREVEEVQ